MRVSNSGAAIALLAGNDALAASSDQINAADVDILKTAHADLLASTIKTLGGVPGEAKKTADYHFPTDKLKNDVDVLRFAAGLEKGAVSAYPHNIRMPSSHVDYRECECVPNSVGL